MRLLTAQEQMSVSMGWHMPCTSPCWQQASLKKTQQLFARLRVWGPEGLSQGAPHLCSNQVQVQCACIAKRWKIGFRDVNCE